MKAKLSIKKALSLIVVAVMLLTMIPMGIIPASAAPTIDLGDYDYTEEYVIMNTEDWLLIANAQDKDFSGKTIKLGADLDFGAFTSVWDPSHASGDTSFEYAQRFDGVKPASGQEIAITYAATVPTLFNNFAGKFDGDGHTIRNAKFEEGGIAKVTTGEAQIMNVTFENVTVTDYYDYFAYGIVAGKVEGSLFMKNVHVVASEVFGDTFNTFHFASGGALIGLISAADGVENAYVNIMDCSVNADVACGNYMAWGYGYGTGLAIGTVDPNVDFDMSYCSFSGSVDSQDWFIGTIGALYVGKERTANINNITINGLSVNSDRKAVTDGMQSMGSLAGVVSIYDNASVTIDKITVKDANLYSNNAHGVGGLLGMIQPTNAPYLNGGPAGNNTAGGTLGGGRPYSRETVEGAAVQVSNIYVDAYAWSDSTVGGGIGAAGLIAQVGQGNNSNDAAGRIMAGDIDIYNIYVTGTVITGKYDAALDTWTLSQGSGGLFYAVSLAEANIDVSNVVIDVNFPVEPQYYEAPEGIADADDATKKAYSAEVKKCIGLISSGAHVRQKSTGDYVGGDDAYLEAYLTVSDVATTLRGEFNLFSWLNRKGGIYYNGEDIGRGDKAAYAPPVENDTVVQVRPIEAAQMVQLDANGFVKKVTGALAPVAVQATEGAIRFIALAYVDEVAVATATVTFVDEEGNEKTFTFDSVSLLDGLTAVEGTDIEEFAANDFYAKKLMAVTIKGIPADTKFNVSWSFAYETLDGFALQSETATGVLNADGSFKMN